jgi:hypothetical protein
MVKKINLISLILLIAIILTTVFISGCAFNSENTQITETPTIQPTEKETLALASSSVNSTIKVPWPQDENPVPPYSDEEKALLVEEAKEEIMRVFPEIDEDTLDSYSWGSKYYSYISPAIVFTRVVDKTNLEERKALSEDFDRRFVDIKYDPKRKIICSYAFNGSAGFNPDDEPVVSSEDAEDHALEFYKKVMGDEYESHKDDLIVIRDDGEDLNSVFLNVEIATTYKGVVYFYDCSNVIYDMTLDAVDVLSFCQRDHDILSQITTLSEVPDITIDEAKKILEAQLKENNGGNDVDIEYCQRLGYYYFPNLQWLDTPYYMDIKDGYVRNPLKLIWELPFTTTDGSIHYGIIDAHSGEILSIYP